MNYPSKFIVKLPSVISNKRMIQDLSNRVEFFRKSNDQFSKISIATENMDSFKSSVLSISTNLYEDLKNQLKQVINTYIDYHVFIGQITGAIYQCMSAVDLLIHKVNGDSIPALKRRISDIMVYVSKVVFILIKFQKSIAA